MRNKTISRALLPIFVFLNHSFLAFNHVIGHDEGVALYTGRVILEGGAPYVDSWDHKGPVIYFLNAAGLWISQNAVWGPGVLEGLLLAVAVSLVIHQLQQFWSPFVVNSIMIAFLISYYFFMESLNLTESWTLGVQIIAYSLIFVASNQNPFFDSERMKKVLLFVTLGLSFSIVFYTRPNNSIGILLATLTLSVVSLRSFAFKGLTFFLLTFFSFSALIMSYLSATGSFSQFIEQFLVYNLDYSSAGSVSNRLDASLHSLYRLVQTPLVLLIVLAFFFMIRERSSWLDLLKKAKISLAILVGLLGDFFFSFLSARGYLHYMIIILPSLMIVVGVLHSFLAERNSGYRRFSVYVLSGCILFGAVFGIEKVNTRFYSDPGDLKGVSKFLSTNSVDTDHIQVLGSDTRVLVLAGRESSSSLTYSHPATSVFYRNAKQSVTKLENDVKSRTPKYIVRNIRSSCDLSRPKCSERKHEYSEEDLAPLYTWIIRNYQVIKVIGDYEIWYSGED